MAYNNPTKWDGTEAMTMIRKMIKEQEDRDRKWQRQRQDRYDRAQAKLVNIMRKFVGLPKLEPLKQLQKIEREDEVKYLPEGQIQVSKDPDVDLDRDQDWDMKVDHDHNSIDNRYSDTMADRDPDVDIDLDTVGDHNPYTVVEAVVNSDDSDSIDDDIRAGQNQDVKHDTVVDSVVNPDDSDSIDQDTRDPDGNQEVDDYSDPVVDTTVDNDPDPVVDTESDTVVNRNPQVKTGFDSNDFDPVDPASIYGIDKDTIVNQDEEVYPDQDLVVNHHSDAVMNHHHDTGVGHNPDGKPDRNDSGTRVDQDPGLVTNLDGDSRAEQDLDLDLDPDPVADNKAEFALDRHTAPHRRNGKRHIHSLTRANHEPKRDSDRDDFTAIYRTMPPTNSSESQPRDTPMPNQGSTPSRKMSVKSWSMVKLNLKVKKETSSSAYGVADMAIGKRISQDVHSKRFYNFKTEPPSKPKWTRTA